MAVLGRACLLVALLFSGPVESQELEQNALNGIGSAACRCIDPWASTLGPTHSQCHNVTVSGVRECLPANYGAGRCRPWDMDAHVCRHGGGATMASRVSSQLGWCSSSWCYVNTSTCARPHKLSQIRWHDLPAEVASRLAYSYETCGNLDEYSPSKHRDRMRNRTLRVSYPGDSGSGYTIKTVAQGQGWHGKDGSMVAFVHTIAERSGIRLQFHPVSNASKTQVRERLGSGSSFTQCVHEVALNETDLCIGNFWMTNERLLMTPFSGTVYEDMMRLVVLNGDVKQSFWTTWARHIQVPFRPFNSYGWMLVMVTVMFASIVLHIVEDDSYNFEWREVTSSSLQKTVAESKRGVQALIHGDEIMWDHPEPSCADRIEKHCGCEDHALIRSALRSVARSLGGINSSCYYGLMGLLGGDPKHEVTTVPGRTILVGFAFFGVSILASYTASLTSLIVEANTAKRTIGNWNDVVTDTRPVCIRSAMLDNFARAYPGFDQARLVTYDTRECTPGETTRGCSVGSTWGANTIDAADQMLNSLDAGECIAAIIFSDAWERKFNTGTHCNKAAVDNLFGVPNGMPIREELQASLSYLVQEAVAAGEYKKFEVSKRRQFLPAKYSCHEDSDGTENEGVLGPDHLFGPALVSCICTVCALIIYYCFGFSQVHVSHMHHGKINEAEDEKKLLLQLDPVSLVYRAETNMSSPANLMQDELEQAKIFNAALDQLPDKRGLVSLIMRQEGTAEGKQVIKLKQSSISVLYHLALSIHPQDHKEAWVAEVHKCLKGEYKNYDDDNPKDALVHLLLDRLDDDGDDKVTMKELDAGLQGNEGDGNQIVNPLAELQ